MPINHEDILYIPNSLLMRNDPKKTHTKNVMDDSSTLSHPVSIGLFFFFSFPFPFSFPPNTNRGPNHQLFHLFFIHHTPSFFLPSISPPNATPTFVPSPLFPFCVELMKHTQILRQRKLEVDPRMLRMDKGPLSTFGNHIIPLWMDKTLVPEQLSLTVKVEKRR